MIGFFTAPFWLPGNRPTGWITPTAPITSPISAGCATLFLNYLRCRLGCSWAQIVHAAGPTLVGSYQRLTGNGGAFDTFKLFVPREYASSFADLATGNPFPAGGGPAVAPAAGTLDALARYGVQVAHWHYRATGGFSGVDPLPGQAAEYRASAVSWGPGRLDVLARGADRQLLHWWPRDGSAFGTPGEPGGAILVSGPAAVSTGFGRLDVSARGVSQRLHHWRDPDSAGTAGISPSRQIAADALQRPERRLLGARTARRVHRGRRRRPRALVAR